MEKILSTVNSPADLKLIPKTRLKDLAAEIRHLMLSTVSESGGHLAPNLGVVELTIALHYVFNTPNDKIVWDVGHQSYVHKILTGRRDAMSTLRQYRGMSGFPRIDESIYDAFGTGHSSTAISAALGLATARDLKGENHKVIAVVGDGALTGGMSWEALNNAGTQGLDLTVILNDNAMSISPNVGALSAYLSKIRTNPHYYRTKSELEQGINKIPGIGEDITKLATKLKDTVKNMMVPGLLFNELGFNYIGPISGHNLEELIPVFQNIKDMKGPLLLHVVTQKGCGYEPATTSPHIFHGVSPFDLETGQPIINGTVPTYTQVFTEKLLEMAAENKKIIAITAAMADGTGLTPFKKAHPERFFDVGICEQHAVTMSAALSMEGFKPIVCIYSSFMQRAYDQLIHDVALQRQPVVFILDRAGLVGEDGATHHGVFDISFLRIIPNFTLMAPASDYDLQQMLSWATTEADHPVAIRFSRGTVITDEKILPHAPLTYGKFQVVTAGNRIAVIAVGNLYSLAFDVHRSLQTAGLSPTLINARFIKPLDEQLLLTLAQKHKYIITIENNVLKGGFGSAISEFLSDSDLNHIKLWRIGVPDVFIQHGDIPNLLNEIGLTPDNLLTQCKSRWPELFVTERPSIP